MGIFGGNKKEELKRDKVTKSVEEQLTDLQNGFNDFSSALITKEDFNAGIVKIITKINAVAITEKSISEGLEGITDQEPKQSVDNDTKLVGTSVLGFSLEEDKKKWEMHASDVRRWVGYIREIAKTYEDEVLYEIRELLGNDDYHMYRLKKVLSVPVNADESHTLSELSSVISIKEAEENISLKEVARRIGGLSVKTPGESDFGILEKDQSPTVNAFAKEILNSVFLLNLKRLESAKKELIKLLQETLEGISVLEMSLSEPDFLEIEPQENEKVTEENFKLIQELGACSKDFRKKYFKYLDFLFKAYDGFHSGHESFKKRLEDLNEEEKAFIDPWHKLYESLKRLLLSYLERYLHIIPIACEPGDIYHHDLHKPVSEGEPEDAMDDDQVKSIDYLGFRLIGENQAGMNTDELRRVDQIDISAFQVIRQTGVVIVLNKTK